MKKIGVWLDKKQAILVEINNQGEQLKKIESNIDFFRPKGGSRTRSAKWGPQDVVQDSKYLEREKHQLSAYFDSIATHLKEFDSVAFFGPAGTNEKLRDYVVEKYDMAEKIKGVEKVDSMTENQVKALVRNYFSDN